MSSPRSQPPEGLRGPGGRPARRGAQPRRPRVQRRPTHTHVARELAGQTPTSLPGPARHPWLSPPPPMAPFAALPPSLLCPHPTLGAEVASGPEHWLGGR